MKKENIINEVVFNAGVNDEELCSMFGSIAILPMVAVGAAIASGVNWLTESVKGLVED